jgi:cobyrinic acid a,c-diamide synthase
LTGKMKVGVKSLDRFPRLVIAGMSGDSGKTLVSLGIILKLQECGLAVRAFKKGPDYVDAAWLSWASGHPARNLDTFLMGFPVCATSFLRSASASALNLIEGNRGLFDGSDAEGTHSTAALAKLLDAPVILVLNATKASRTVAACALGCQKLDPRLWIAGVILNQVNGSRHEQIVRTAVEKECRIPVLGALPRVDGSGLLPARHLGLVMPEEHSRIDELKNNVKELVASRLDIDQIISIGQNVASLPKPIEIHDELADGHGLCVGFLSDSALSFYYPLTAADLPWNLDALYVGGGFPETHGAALSSNRRFLTALKTMAQAGLPVYAECGGLMLLSEAIRWRAERYPMAGFFPFEVEVFTSPQGHGYVELLVDRANPFFPPGTSLRGHEFHYSGIVSRPSSMDTACSVLRGTGCGNGRDGVVRESVWASYTHLHALGTPEWARGLLQAARKYSARRLSRIL